MINCLLSYLDCVAGSVLLVPLDLKGFVKYSWDEYVPGKIRTLNIGVQAFFFL